MDEKEHCDLHNPSLSRRWAKPRAEGEKQEKGGEARGWGKEGRREERMKYETLRDGRRSQKEKKKKTQPLGNIIPTATHNATYHSVIKNNIYREPAAARLNEREGGEVKKQNKCLFLINTN